MIVLARNTNNEGSAVRRPSVLFVGAATHHLDAAARAGASV